MSQDDKPKKALYLGSFPVSQESPPDRARFIAQQLDHINKSEHAHPSGNGTPVEISMQLCGIKVTADTTKDTYMVHALRRVSFSTCLDELFAFAARDPGQPLNRQFCHVFKTQSSDILNSVIGGAFQSAYTLRKQSDDLESCASGRDSRQSNISTMSTTSAMYQNTGNKSYAPRESPRIGSERTGSARTGSTHSHVNSLQAEETFSDYQVDYEPETHSGTHSADFCVTEEKTERTTDYRSGSTTVRSKLSAHSDDSAISSLADDLERRVIIEIEKNESKRRESTQIPINPTRSSGRRRSFKKPAPVANIFSVSRSTADSSGYSSINLDSDYGQSGQSTTRSKFSEKLHNIIHTNPVARKLKLLAPGDSYSDLDSRLRTARWYHQGLPKDVAISVLSQAETGTFLVLPQTLLLRGLEHVHEYQIIKENKIGWYLKGSSRAFPHLLMLVAHYQTHRDILPLVLDNAPVPK